MEKYKVGDVAGLLKECSKSKDAISNRLAAIFTSKQSGKSIEFAQVKPKQPTPSSRKLNSSSGNTKKRRVLPDDEETNVGPSLKKKKLVKDKRKQRSQNFLLSHNTAVKKEKSRHVVVSKNTAAVKREESKSTIFIGNLPITIKKKAIRTLFSQFGVIDNIRLRSAPVPDFVTSKKVAVIKQDFHPLRHNINAYIKFASEENAEKALALNGHEIQGNHIRVDMADNNTSHDHKKSVFLGNLPYKIEEETIHQHFSDCGTIKGIRIIRDNKTGIGKGFGYVLFESVDSVHLALRLNGKSLSGRELRVSRSVDIKNKKSEQKTPEVRNYPKVDHPHSFQGSVAKPINKKKKHFVPKVKGTKTIKKNNAKQLSPGIAQKGDNVKVKKRSISQTEEKSSSVTTKQKKKKVGLIF